MSTRPALTDINSYIAQADAAAKPVLEEIRKTIQQAVPDATETISYQMPAFKLGKTFIYFAAFKKHIGMYPPVKNDAELKQTLAPYANDKGNLKFYLHEPMPYALIARVALALKQQYQSTP